MSIPPAPAPLYMSAAEFAGRSRRAPEPPRFKALGDYRAAARDLTEHLENFPIYDKDGLLSEWIAVNSGRIARLNGLLGGFHDEIQIVIDKNPHVTSACEVEDKPRLEVPGALVAAQFESDTTLDLDGTNGEVAASVCDAVHPLSDRSSDVVNVVPLVERVAGSVVDDGAGHETSPSGGGCGDPTVGDGPVAEGQEEASATAGTDTPDYVDTSPLVVHRTASLQDAISARDDVFLRIRNITAQPLSEFACEQLPMLVEELRVEQLHVNRWTAKLEHARAAEVSRGESGMFSNRRRPGARFSNPTPPAAPETPDAAQ